ncbi:hypothetical protein STEG23_038216, partial [Scotinomys teguina]
MSPVISQGLQHSRKLSCPLASVTYKLTLALTLPATPRIYKHACDVQMFWDKPVIFSYKNSDIGPGANEESGFIAPDATEESVRFPALTQEFNSPETKELVENTGKSPFRGAAQIANIISGGSYEKVAKFTSGPSEVSDCIMHDEPSLQTPSGRASILSNSPKSSSSECIPRASCCGSAEAAAEDDLSPKDLNPAIKALGPGFTHPPLLITTKGDANAIAYRVRNSDVVTFAHSFTSSNPVLSLNSINTEMYMRIFGNYECLQKCTCHVMLKIMIYLKTESTILSHVMASFQKRPQHRACTKDYEGSKHGKVGREAPLLPPPSI